MVIPDEDDAFQLIDVILLLLTKRETIDDFTCFAAFSENTINSVWSVIVDHPKLLCSTNTAVQILQNSLFLHKSSSATFTTH